MTISGATWGTYMSDLRSGIETELTQTKDQLVIAILYKILSELGLAAGYADGSQYWP